jgi:hypothetical protein
MPEEQFKALFQVQQLLPALLCAVRLQCMLLKDFAENESVRWLRLMAAC